MLQEIIQTEMMTPKWNLNFQEGIINAMTGKYMDKNCIPFLIYLKYIQLKQKLWHPLYYGVCNM